ncbi:MAG: PAS domain S-box protein [Sedimentisphaerales bacterium]
MSIRLKLTIMFLAIAMIPLLFVSALTFTNYKKSLEANRLAQLRDLAIFRADRIEAYFAGLKGHIEIAQGFYNIKRNLPILIRLADEPNNPEFLAARKMLDGQLQQMALVSDLSDIMLVNPQGKVVYAIKPGHYSKDMPNGVDAEQKAFTEGKSRIYFSDVYFDKVEDNRFETLLAAPASDFNGAFIGVIAFEVDMTPIYNLIQDTTGLDITGEVLVARKIGNQAEFLNPLRHDPNAALKRRVSLGGEVGRPIQEAVQGRTGSGLSIDYRGKKVIAAWRYIPSLDWGLVAKIDIEEAFADVTNLRNLAAVVLVIVIVLSSITAFSIAQSISEPIKRLSEGAGIIGSGNLDYKVATAHKDEIGQLSRTFDKMTGDLKQTLASRDELNREIAERKKVEEALRESKKDLDRAQAVAHSGSWRLDIQNNVLAWSDEAYRIFGVPIETPMTYESFLGFIHPDDRQFVDNRWKAAISGEPYDIEHRIIVDGQTKWVRERAELELANDGTLLGGFGTVTDITQRKQAQEALLASEIRYRRLFEAARDGILILDSDSGRIVDVNPFIKDMLGYSHDELLNKRIWEIGLFKNIAASKDSFLELQTRGFVRYENLPLETKDGRHIAVEFVSNVYSVDHKKVIQYNIRDITDRVRAEEALRKSRDELEIRVKERTAELDESVQELQKQVQQRIKAEEALRASALYMRGLLEASLDPLVTISPEGKITDVNKATELVTGVSREQLIGADFSNYFTEPEKARDGYKQVFANGFVTDYLLTIRHKNGRLTDVLYNAVVYKNEAGRVQGVFAAARDITEKKITEAELEKYRLHLEDLVKHRTEALARSNKDLEQFAYVASHDLQEPLRAVAGFIGLLKMRLEKSLDEKTSEYMNFSVDGVSRMQSLINGLLEYSRIDTSGKPPEPTDSKAALDNALLQLRASIGESGAKITTEKLPTVKIDPVQLVQLFQNLVGNAIKFRSDASPQIHVNASRQDGAWQFAVRDNGIGIDPQYAHKIFLIFQRLHTRKQYPGTGIGLSICKKIVERHGGRIWMESKPGQGSTFYFTIPDVEGA